MRTSLGVEYQNISKDKMYGYLSQSPRDIRRSLGKYLAPEESIEACDIVPGDVVYVTTAGVSAVLGLVIDVKDRRRCTENKGYGTLDKPESCIVSIRLIPLKKFGDRPTQRGRKLEVRFDSSFGSTINGGPASIVRLYRGGSVPYTEIFD